MNRHPPRTVVRDVALVTACVLSGFLLLSLVSTRLAGGTLIAYAAAALAFTVGFGPVLWFVAKYRVKRLS